jgi:uncharacterized membrane protein
MRSRFEHLPERVFLAIMAVGAGLITVASLEYFDSSRVAFFVIEKLPVRHEQLWLGALKVHVASALLTFPACLLLTTRWLQRRRLLHRWLGRVTGVGVVAALVPSGLVLSLEAKGGPLVGVGFMLSGLIVLGAAIGGVLAARRRDYVAHKRAMHHVIGQMSVAVTSRAMLFGFDSLGVDPELAYALALWVPVLGTAAVTEWGSLRRMASLLFVKPVSRSLP